MGRPTSDKGEEGRECKPVGAKAAVSAKPLRRRSTDALSVRIF